jgi:two-component system, cell cycle sensor histidine kinase and response regulator CckA
MISTKQKAQPPAVLAANVPNRVGAVLPQADTIHGAGHGKILVVEDDADVRRVTREVLEGAGYQIWEANDGQEALNIWKTNASKIDLLVADIILPGTLNGWELAARLRKEQPGLKVILISSLAFEQAERNQSRDLILPKPFSLEHLTETVRKCLDETRPAG